MKETQLVRACVEYLRAIGCLAWRTNTGAVVAKYRGRSRCIRFGPRGHPDLLAVTPRGELIAVECKVGRRKPTPEQRVFLETLRRYRVHAIVVYSIDELRDYIRSRVQPALTCSEAKEAKT